MCFISLNSNLGVKFLEEMKSCPKAAVLLEKRCLSTGPSTTGRRAHSRCGQEALRKWWWWRGERGAALGGENPSSALEWWAVAEPSQVGDTETTESEKPRSVLGRRQSMSQNLMVGMHTAPRPLASLCGGKGSLRS